MTEETVASKDTQNQEKTRIITLAQCSNLDNGRMKDISDQLYFIFVSCDAMREYPHDYNGDAAFSGLAFIMEDILKELNSLIDSNKKTIEKIHEQRPNC